MRVLHVQKIKGVGGAERHLLSLLPALAARGVDVRLVVLGTEEESRFFTEADAVGIDTKRIKAGMDVDPSMPVRLARAVREFKPDLLHTHLIHADVYGAVTAAVTRTPRISSVHSVRSFYRTKPVGSIARLAGRPARRTIAISEHVAGYLRDVRLTHPDRIRVVHYGIDGEAWAVGASERISMRSGLGIEPDDFVLGLASNLIPGKGHSTALDAFATALRGAPSARLLIAGEGELRDELERRTATEGLEDRVSFLGFVSDMRAFMGSCDVLMFPTLPSLGEGFGLAALEAMATGRPVIASRLGPLPEIIEDGISGVLVTPGDSGELGTAIVKLSDKALRDAMGVAARERARMSFGLDVMADRTKAVYEEVLQ